MSDHKHSFLRHFRYLVEFSNKGSIQIIVNVKVYGRVRVCVYKIIVVDRITQYGSYVTCLTPQESKRTKCDHLH